MCESIDPNTKEVSTISKGAVLSCWAVLSSHLRTETVGLGDTTSDGYILMMFDRFSFRVAKIPPLSLIMASSCEHGKHSSVCLGLHISVHGRASQLMLAYVSMYLKHIQMRMLVITI